MSKVFYMNFKVDKEISLLDFLREKISSKSKNNIKSFLVKEMVLVNDNIETSFDYKLKKGDIVEIKNNYITNKKYNLKIRIIYEDDDIIVVDKPSGLLSMASNKEKKKTTYNLVRDYLMQTNKNNKVFIVHRLDKDTSGVLILAKNLKAKSMFQNAWSTNVLTKEYIAVVEGHPKANKGTIKTYLKENDEGYVYSVKSGKEGKIAITSFEKIKENKRYTMLKVLIKTGRKNQIRVHLKELGYPIVGDKKYGSGLDPVKRLCLHARKLELINPINNEKMVFESKIPFLLEALM